MSIWNRIGDLTKGTIDWVGDVGLGVLALPKLAWDLGTAPWNDREEYDTFLGTL